VPWKPWIEIEPEDSQNEEAIELYKRTRNPKTNKISDLTKITSLTPEISELINKLSTAVYKNAKGLTPREKEIAALITSSLNGCVH
jgi:alkylhydroperoxidase family enzyme